MGCLISLNRKRIGNIKSVDKKNAGKNTCCLPASPSNANVQLAIGTNSNNANIHHILDIHSPIPVIFPVFFSVETFLSSAL
jgi:hypothetical protein